MALALDLPLDEWLLSFVTPSVLKESIRYALTSGGKMLRPRLLATAYSLYRDDIEVVKESACALEMIHAYSLIHDDLPCMDDDDFRRGKPSVHKAYGEEIAILTGDWLLSRAMEIVAEDPIVSAVLGEKSRLMVEGQALELSSKPYDYFSLYEKKTGALFSAAFLIGGLLAKAPESDLEKLEQAGTLFGVVFQMKDDLEDGDAMFTKKSVREVEEKVRFLLEDLSVDSSSLLELAC